MAVVGFQAEGLCLARPYSSQDDRRLQSESQASPLDNGMRTLYAAASDGFSALNRCEFATNRIRTDAGLGAVVTTLPKAVFFFTSFAGRGITFSVIKEGIFTTRFGGPNSSMVTSRRASRKARLCANVVPVLAEISDTSSHTCVGLTVFALLFDGSGSGAEISAITGSCWTTLRFGAIETGCNKPK